MVLLGCYVRRRVGRRRDLAAAFHLGIVRPGVTPGEGVPERVRYHDEPLPRPRDRHVVDPLLFPIVGRLRVGHHPRLDVHAAPLSTFHLVDRREQHGRVGVPRGRGLGGLHGLFKPGERPAAGRQSGQGGHQRNPVTVRIQVRLGPVADVLDQEVAGRRAAAGPVATGEVDQVIAEGGRGAEPTLGEPLMRAGQRPWAVQFYLQGFSAQLPEGPVSDGHELVQRGAALGGTQVSE